MLFEFSSWFWDTPLLRATERIRHQHGKDSNPQISLPSPHFCVILFPTTSFLFLGLLTHTVWLYADQILILDFVFIIKACFCFVFLLCSFLFLPFSSDYCLFVVLWRYVSNSSGTLTTTTTFVKRKRFSSRFHYSRLAGEREASLDWQYSRYKGKETSNAWWNGARKEVRGRANVLTITD